MQIDTGKQAEAIARWLRLFLRPGQLTELRALHVRGGGTVAGWFDYDHLDLMARHAAELSRSAGGVYFLPNSINPDAAIPGRKRLGPNAVGPGRKDEQTKDEHILYRTWLLVDADPIRPAGTTAAKEQREHAWQVIDRAQACLKAAGYKPGRVGDSGNGWHLCLPVDLPNDDATRERCRKLLFFLQERCGSKQARIDTSTFNAARIWRIYGTQNLKGKHHD